MASSKGGPAERFLHQGEVGVQFHTGTHHANAHQGNGRKGKDFRALGNRMGICGISRRG